MSEKKPKRSPQETLDRLAELDPEFLDPLREDWPDNSIETYRLIQALVAHGGAGGYWLQCAPSHTLSPERLRERNLRVLRRAKQLRETPPPAQPRTEDEMWNAWRSRRREWSRRRNAQAAEAASDDDTLSR